MLCRAIYRTNMCAARLNGSKVFVEEVRKAILPCSRHSLILFYVKVGMAAIPICLLTACCVAFGYHHGSANTGRILRQESVEQCRIYGIQLRGLVLLVVRCRMLVSSRLCLVGVLPSGRDLQLTYEVST